VKLRQQERWCEALKVQIARQHKAALKQITPTGRAASRAAIHDPGRRA
jgi:hypothetical protein